MADFSDTLFCDFLETVVQNRQKQPTEMGTEMEPMCDSLALRRPYVLNSFLLNPLLVRAPTPKTNSKTNSKSISKSKSKSKSTSKLRGSKLRCYKSKSTSTSKSNLNSTSKSKAKSKSKSTSKSTSKSGGYGQSKRHSKSCGLGPVCGPHRWGWLGVGHYFKGNTPPSAGVLRASRSDTLNPKP